MALLNSYINVQGKKKLYSLGVLLLCIAFQNIRAEETSDVSNIDDAITKQMMLDKKTLELDGVSSFSNDEHSHEECLIDGVGLGGYDAVSYRTEGGPLLGEDAYSSDYSNAKYLFINAKNKALFEESPDYYLPQYSGLCAIALALGKVTCPDYENYQIENDQLLLFETTGFTNGRVIWNSNRDQFKIKADSNFLNISQ